MTDTITDDMTAEVARILMKRRGFTEIVITPLTPPDGAPFFVVAAGYKGEGMSGHTQIRGSLASLIEDFDKWADMIDAKKKPRPEPEEEAPPILEVQAEPVVRVEVRDNPEHLSEIERLKMEIADRDAKLKAAEAELEGLSIAALSPDTPMTDVPRSPPVYFSTPSMPAPSDWLRGKMDAMGTDDAAAARKALLERYTALDQIIERDIATSEQMDEHSDIFENLVKKTR